MIIKVPNLNHPGIAVVYRLNFFPELIAKLNVCDFCNLLFHADLIALAPNIRLREYQRLCVCNARPFIIIIKIKPLVNTMICSIIYTLDYNITLPGASVKRNYRSIQYTAAQDMFVGLNAA